ncbi:MAG: SMP-30/gluconolactonase/LRE family protein, partial [Bacteroidota bacterium]
MRLFIIVYWLLIVFSIRLCNAQQHIEILHQQALDILNPKGIVEELACGFAWLEGPLWVENGGYLLFSDIPNNKVYRYRNGEVTEYLSASGFTGSFEAAHQPGSNGLLLDGDGHLVLMQQGDRRVARMIAHIKKPAPVFETLTDRFQGKRLNSPNDGVFDKYGNLYFTDPSYGLAGLDDDPAMELTSHGVYCLKVDGTLLLLDTLRFANGIGLSPDGKVLYVSQS